MRRLILMLLSAILLLCGSAALAQPLAIGQTGAVLTLPDDYSPDALTRQQEKSGLALFCFNKDETCYIEAYLTEGTAYTSVSALARSIQTAGITCQTVMCGETECAYYLQTVGSYTTEHYQFIYGGRLFDIVFTYPFDKGFSTASVMETLSFN